MDLLLDYTTQSKILFCCWNKLSELGQGNTLYYCSIIIDKLIKWMNFIVVSIIISKFSYFHLFSYAARTSFGKIQMI